MIFIGANSDRCLVLSVIESVRALFETWLMWPWHVKIHASSPKVTQPLLLSVLTAMLLTLEQNKTMLLMLEQNKTHDVDAGWKRMPFCWSWNKTKAFYFLLPFQTFWEEKVFIKLFIWPKSNHCPALSVTPSVSFSSCWDLIDVTLACEDSPIPLLVLPAVVSLDFS